MNLLINLYFGDSYGENDSFFWELIKSLLAVIPVIIGLRWQKKIDEDKQNRIKVEEQKLRNENLKLQLFNFNEHMKGVIKSMEKVIPLFTKYSENLMKLPFEEHLLQTKIKIPDLYRIEFINKEDIFNAFLMLYSNKLKAANDYRNVYNYIQYYKEIFEMMYNQSDSFNEDIYKQKIKFQDNIFSIKTNILTFILKNKETINNEPYYGLNQIMMSFHKTEMEELKNGGFTLQHYYDNFMEPLMKFLPKYENNEELRNIYIKIIENNRLKEDIIHYSKQLGELLSVNVKEIPKCQIKLVEVNNKLEKVLKDYYS